MSIKYKHQSGHCQIGTRSWMHSWNSLRGWILSWWRFSWSQYGIKIECWEDGRYTTFIRDFLELADPKSLRSGMRWHDILEDDLVENIFRHRWNHIIKTIYQNDITKFLESSRSFITYFSENNVKKQCQYALILPGHASEI